MMRAILPIVMMASSFFCAPRTSRLDAHLPQSRASVKNLAGGLLVPPQVIDFRPLLV